MKSLQHYVDQMKQLLNELLQVATKLRDISLQVISEEELAPLQKHQEELLVQLKQIDQQIQSHYAYQMEAATKAYIHDQLQIFQQLNQEYVQNLNASQGIIQFELHRLENEENFSEFSRLNKMSPPPNSPEAVETEEDEEG